MRAALAGRQDPSLVIVGRTSAVAITAVEDAVVRLQAYEQAGVDALFPVGVKTRAQLSAIASAVKLPLIVGDAVGELNDLAFLKSAGARVCLQGHQPFMAAARAVYDTMRALRDGVDPTKRPNLAAGDLLKQVTRESAYRDWIKEFLTA